MEHSAFPPLTPNISAPNTQPKMDGAPIEENEGEVLKVSGVDLYQSKNSFTFDETKFNEIFDEAEKIIYAFSRTEVGTQLFNDSKPTMSNITIEDAIKKHVAIVPPDKPTRWESAVDSFKAIFKPKQVIINKKDESISRDITQEIKYIPPIIKERAKTIIKYFLLHRLATRNVFTEKIQDGMYKVISFAIIEYFLTMHEWDNIFRKIHEPFANKYDLYILQDVKRFIQGMLVGFDIYPSTTENEAVSKEISDMMNLVIREIVRSLALYGGKMRNRSINKRMKRRTAKCKRMKRRTKMHKKKC